MLKPLERMLIVSRVRRVPMGGGTNLHGCAELPVGKSETLLANPKIGFSRHLHSRKLPLCVQSFTRANPCADFGQYRSAFRNAGNNPEHGL